MPSTLQLLLLLGRGTIGNFMPFSHTVMLKYLKKEAQVEHP
jgi:hypothetical protein